MRRKKVLRALHILKKKKPIHFRIVADPDPGSGAVLTPGSGISFFRIPVLRSQIPIPNPYFWELFGKKYYNS